MFQIDPYSLYAALLIVICLCALSYLEGRRAGQAGIGRGFKLDTGETSSNWDPRKDSYKEVFGGAPPMPKVASTRKPRIRACRCGGYRVGAI